MKITKKRLREIIREVLVEELDEATTGGAIGGKKIGGGKPGATPIAQAVSSPSKGGGIKFRLNASLFTLFEYWSTSWHYYLPGGDHATDYFKNISHFYKAKVDTHGAHISSASEFYKKPLWMKE